MSKDEILKEVGKVNDAIDKHHQLVKLNITLYQISNRMNVIEDELAELQEQARLATIAYNELSEKVVS